MNVLIAYATKSGASRVCAEALAKCFNSAAVADLSKASPALERYDAVILGSGIRIGRAYRPLRRFLKENKALLTARPLALFFCNAEPGSFDQAVHKNIPPELLTHALCVRSFGGKQPFSRTQDTAWMDKAAVEALAAAVKSAL